MKIAKPGTGGSMNPCPICGEKFQWGVCVSDKCQKRRERKNTFRIPFIPRSKKVKSDGSARFS